MEFGEWELCRFCSSWDFLKLSLPYTITYAEVMTLCPVIYFMNGHISKYTQKYGYEVCEA